MKNLMLAALLLPAAIAAAGPAEDIKAIHGQLAQAMRSGQADAYAKTFLAHSTSDFALFELMGQRTDRKSFLAQIKGQLAHTKFSKYGYQLGPATSGRTGVMVTAVLQYASTYKDPAGKPHKQVGTVTFEENWMLVGKSPKLRRMRVHSSVTSTDGKPPVKRGGGPTVRARAAF